MNEIIQCDFCDSFDVSEVTPNNFFCHDCGEKFKLWAVSEIEMN